MMLSGRVTSFARSLRSAAPLSTQISQRFVVDTTDRLVAVKSLSNNSDVLQFYLQNPDMDTASLEATLRNLAKSEGTRDDKIALVNDERFVRLVSAVHGRLDVCDGRQLAMIANALAFFPVHSIEMKELAQKLATVTIRRENAFTPRNLSTISMSFAALGVRDVFVVDFIRHEAVKMMQDFRPADLYMLMDSFRRLGVFPRDLFDLIVEKMQDEVDRFTAHEMAETLKVLSQVGLAKGFLIRRLANLAHESRHVLPPKTALSVYCSLAKLRFVDDRLGADFLDIIMENLSKFNSAEKSNLLLSMGLVELMDGQTPNAQELALEVIRSYMSDPQWNKSLLNMTQVAWAIPYFQLFDGEGRESFAKLLKAILGMPKTNNATILKILAEVQASVELDKFSPALDATLTNFPPVWQAGIADAVIKDSERNEGSRLFSELMVELDSLRGPSKMIAQRNQPAGPYMVDFLDEASKVVLEVDTITKPTPRGLKNRHLAQLGFKPATLGYWQWRRCRSDADKALLLAAILDKPLKLAGRK